MGWGSFGFPVKRPNLGSNMHKTVWQPTRGSSNEVTVCSSHGSVRRRFGIFTNFLTSTRTLTRLPMSSWGNIRIVTAHAMVLETATISAKISGCNSCCSSSSNSSNSSFCRGEPSKGDVPLRLLSGGRAGGRYRKPVDARCVEAI